MCMASAASQETWLAAASVLGGSCIGAPSKYFTMLTASIAQTKPVNTALVTALKIGITGTDLTDKALAKNLWDFLAKILNEITTKDEIMSLLSESYQTILMSAPELFIPSLAMMAVNADPKIRLCAALVERRVIESGLAHDSHSHWLALISDPDAEVSREALKTLNAMIRFAPISFSLASSGILTSLIRQMAVRVLTFSLLLPSE
jgi:hypothetical protein